MTEAIPDFVEAAIATGEDVIQSLRWQILADCKAAGMTPEEAIEYSDAILTYLALAQSNFAQRSSTLVSWENQHEKPRYTFARHALAMVWDYAEVNPFGRLGFMRCVEQIADVLEKLPIDAEGGTAHHADAASLIEQLFGGEIWEGEDGEETP